MLTTSPVATVSPCSGFAESRTSASPVVIPTRSSIPSSHAYWRIASAAARALGVVLVRDRDTKQRHHRIADEPLDRAPMPLELLAHARVIRSEQRPGVLRIQLLRLGGEANSRSQNRHVITFRSSAARRYGSAVERSAAKRAERELSRQLLPAAVAHGRQAPSVGRKTQAWAYVNELWLGRTAGAGGRLASPSVPNDPLSNLGSSRRFRRRGRRSPFRDEYRCVAGRDAPRGAGRRRRAPAPARSRRPRGSRSGVVRPGGGRASTP